jgi:fumarylacetoacetate (FAA) hydrolase
VKLLSYDTPAGPRAGVLTPTGDRVLDVTTLLGSREPLRDVRALLELPDSPLDRLRAALAAGTATPGLPLADMRLRAPVLQPPTIRDFIAYEAHAGHGRRLRGEEIPEVWYRLPIFYFSNPLRIFGPEATIPYPSATEVLDYELEVGVVIGKEGSNVREADWLDYVAGFTIFNDWSCRDIQRDEQAVGLGPAKGKDAATSLGPVLVTPDELDVRDGRLHARCSARVNGVEWMSNDSGIAYHSWGAMIERVARDSRIVPGDVLGSGTVTGGSIGEAIRDLGKPAHYLRPGDVVEMEIEGIGVLRNTIGPREFEDPQYRFKAKEGVFVMPAPKAAAGTASA